MKASSLTAALCVALLVVGCGGGGGGGKKKGSTAPPAPSAPTPAASVGLTLATSPISADIAAGDDLQPTLSGTWSASNLGTKQVYLQVADSGGTFVVPAVVQAPTGNQYQYTLRVVDRLAAGPRSGTFTIRACEDTQCVRPYQGATVSTTYQLNVRAVGEWETHQRNAAHDGYVPIRLDATRFAKIWEWTRPVDPTVGGYLSTVATFDGKVFVSEDGFDFFNMSVYAFNEQDGSLAWKRSFSSPSGPVLSAPAAAGGKVYLTVLDRLGSFLWGFDASTGTPVFQAPLRTTDETPMFAPTPSNGRVYVSGEMSLGDLSAFDGNSGATLWSIPASGDVNTPALDATYAYHYSGPTMDRYDLATGALATSVADPNHAPPFAFYGSPILGSTDHAIAYSGAANGVNFSSSFYRASRNLVDYSMANGSVRWQTGRQYITIPAVAKGVVYAASNQSQTFDAIDEATGQVLWSWTPPEAPEDLAFVRNVVVTENLVFVSTYLSSYALDLTTHQVVWQGPSGSLAISAQRTLYISTGPVTSRGKLVAYRLR